MAKHNKLQTDTINIVFFLCLLPVLFVCIGSFYLMKLESILQQDLAVSIQDVGKNAAKTAFIRMNNGIIRLEGIAANPLLTDKSISLFIKMDILREKAKKHQWVDLLIADKDGITKSIYGKDLNVSRRKYFAKAMQGIPYYSSILNSPLYTRAVVALAVPLKRDGVIVGALVGLSFVDSLKFTVDATLNPELNTTLQFMDDANILLSDKKILDEDFYAKVIAENNLAGEAAASFVANKGNFDKPLLYNGEKSYISINPIGNSGWNAITIMEESTAIGEVNQVLHFSIGIVLIMVLLLVSYIFYLFKIRKTYKHHSTIAETALHIDSVFYVSIDSAGKILYYNESLSKALPLQENTSNYFTNFCENINFETFRLLLENKEPFVLPLINRNKNKVFIQWNILPNAEKNTWLLFGIDVSAHHHKVQMKLAKSHNDDLQQILDNLPSPIMMHGLDGEILMANSITKELLGVEDLDSIYKALQLGAGEEVFDRQLRLIKEVENSGKSLSATRNFTIANGSTIVFEIVQNPLFDEDGNVKATVSLSQDITASVDMKMKLEEEISRLQAILDNCPAGVFFSKDHIIQYCNPAAQEIAGVYTGGPSPSGDTMVEGDVAKLLYNTTHGLDTYSEPFTIRDPKGNLRNLLITAISVIWRDERVSVLWALDVTQMRSIQQELTIARDEAQLATRAKGDFLATMSHEIRTPMNAILGFLHLFERKNLSEKQNSYLEKLTMSATGLLRIINDILDFSKIEANKMDLEIAPFDLENCMDAIYSVMFFTANAKGIDFNKNIDVRVPQIIIGDRERLNQILLNLLGNAIKFTDQGSVSLEVKLRETIDDSHICIDFIVSDTGIGLSEEQAEKLFQPFTQADTSTSRRFGGTGLGLVISMRLAELMGGKISLKSKLGEGSTFTCSIIAEIDKNLSLDDLQNNSSQVYGGAGSEDVDISCLVGAKVLLVEDNMINQEIAAALLEHYQLQLDFANNGEEAIEKVSLNIYDLVLMDVQMPVIDGLEATRRIRILAEDIPYLEKLPIIAMTANVLLEDKQRCADAGMDGHVAKPISPHELQKTLLYWICGLGE